MSCADFSGSEVLSTGIRGVCLTLDFSLSVTQLWGEMRSGTCILQMNSTKVFLGINFTKTCLGDYLYKDVLGESTLIKLERFLSSKCVFKQLV